MTASKKCGCFAPTTERQPLRPRNAIASVALSPICTCRPRATSVVGEQYIEGQKPVGDGTVAVSAVRPQTPKANEQSLGLPPDAGLQRPAGRQAGAPNAARERRLSLLLEARRSRANPAVAPTNA